MFLPIIRTTPLDEFETSLRAAGKGLAIFSLFAAIAAVTGGSFSQYQFSVFVVPMAFVYLIGLFGIFSSRR